MGIIVICSGMRTPQLGLLFAICSLLLVYISPGRRTLFFGLRFTVFSLLFVKRDILENLGTQVGMGLRDISGTGDILGASWKYFGGIGGT